VLTLDGRRFTVIGVLPETIKKAAGGEIYAPIGLWVKEMMERGAHGDTIVMARLKTEFTQEAASAEMSTIAGRLAREYPGTNTGYGVNVTSLRDSIVGDSKTPLLLLLGGVGFVLLIACANVANLLLVRATTRGKEFAIRSALGAGRSRIARQLLTESMALALAAGTVGLLLGNWGIGWLLTLVPEGILQGTTVGIDRPVLAFTGGISVLTAIIFGLAPALQTSRLNLNEALKEGGRSSSDAPGRHRLRRTLAVAEIALALVLAISSGLMLRSFRILLRVDPGFDPHHVLTMQVNLPNTSYGSADQIAVFSRQALDRIAALPGVTNAALGTSLPLTNDHSRSDISIEGRPLPAPGQFPHPDFHQISAAYPKVLGLPLLRGRLFTDADNASAPEVAIISESLARRYWPDEDPIGKRFSLGKPRPTTKWATIVGVVGDTKQYGLDAQAHMEVYLSYLQHPMYSPVFMARSSTKPEVLTAAMRTAIQGIDPDLPVHDESTMDDVVASSVGTRRIMMQLFAIFAALALVLATVGIYGVISYSVAQRTQEIGIRMALGAQGRSVLGLVIGQGLRLALAGIVIGLAGAAVLTHLLASLLFGVEPIDLTTFSCVAALYVLITVAACYFPARRAMKVDPTIALRCG
jgi:putative ABC transport system permease protein